MKLELLAFINNIPQFVLVSVLIVLILLSLGSNFLRHELRRVVSGVMKRGRTMRSNYYHNQSKCFFIV